MYKRIFVAISWAAILLALLLVTLATTPTTSSQAMPAAAGPIDQPGGLAAGGVMTVAVGASKDNTLYEDTQGSLSNGLGDYFFAGTNSIPGFIRRGVIAFDVAGSGIPAGATVLTTELRLYMSKSIAPIKTVSLHRLQADWGEGTSHAGGEEGGGAFSTPGDATWIHTFYTTTLWSTIGGDFVASPSASQSVGGVGFYTWDSTPTMVADVQGWLDNPAGNFGWLVLNDEIVQATAKRFNTKDNTDPSTHPRLVIYYTFTNNAPTADAGPDQRVEPGAAVTLDGSGSSDPDGHTPLTYGWSQTAGPAVTLSDPTAVMPTFTAPGTAVTLTFSLVVTDSLGLASAPDSVDIIVTEDSYSIYMPAILKE